LKPVLTTRMRPKPKIMPRVAGASAPPVISTSASPWRISEAA
jgi:hypothetical protein